MNPLLTLDKNNYKKKDNEYSIYPVVSMTSKDFLHKIYNINNFDDIIEWMNNNNYYPEETKRRIHNCVWKVYANKLNNDIIDFYYNMMINNWFDSYVDELKDLFTIGLLDGVLIIEDINYVNDKMEKMESTNNKNKLIIINELKDKYMNYPIFYKSIKEYASVNNPNIVKSSDYLDDIRKYIYNVLLEKII